MKLNELFTGTTAFVTEGSDDDRHSAAEDKTGFWGEKGAGCVIMARKTGRFLIAHRSRAVNEPGTWGVWGGAIDRGEDPMVAAQREIEEETGYAGPVEMTPLYVFRKDRFRYHNFLAVVEDEFDPTLDWENQGSRWCEFGEWPNRLHFGLRSLLGDAKSVRIMRAAIADAKSGKREVHEGLGIFGGSKSKTPRPIRIMKSAPTRIEALVDGVFYVICSVLDATPRSKQYIPVWQIKDKEGHSLNKEFSGSGEALNFLKTGPLPIG